jgi:hypothetical protein
MRQLEFFRWRGLKHKEPKASTKEQPQVSQKPLKNRTTILRTYADNQPQDVLEIDYMQQLQDDFADYLKRQEEPSAVKTFIKQAERGLTLLELLTWLSIVSFVSISVHQILKLQVEHMRQAQYAKFYDELNAIDNYLQDVEDPLITYGEKFIELETDDRHIKLQDTGDGVTMYVRRDTAEVTLHYTFITDFTVYAIDKLAIQSDTDMYTIPTSNTFQVMYNTKEDARFREGVIYTWD